MKSRSIRNLFSIYFRSRQIERNPVHLRNIDRVPVFELTALESRILFGGAGNTGGDTFPVVSAPYTVDIGDQTSSNNNDNNNNKSCCDGNTVIDSSSVSMGGAAASGDPVQLSDGMPIISSNDLEANVLGITWGVTRQWTGLNNSGPVGNGWSLSELPYLVVAGSTDATGNWGDPGATPPASQYLISSTEYLNDRISLVEGKSSFQFAIPSAYGYTSADPNAYTSFPAMGAIGATLTRVPMTGGGHQMQLTDSEGDVTEFYDVATQDDAGTTNPRPVYFPTGIGPLYGMFKSYTAANGTTVTATYTDGQLASETISNPNSSHTAEFDYSYGTITNDLQTDSTINDIPTSLSVVPNTLATTDTYSYRVTAVGAWGESLGSTEVTVENGPLSTSGDYNKLTFNTVSGAHLYRIYRGPAGAETYWQADTAPATSGTDTVYDYGVAPLSAAALVQVPTAPSMLTEVDEKINSTTIVNKVLYDYYTGRVPDGVGGYDPDPNGRLGDLRTVTTEEVLSGGGVEVTGVDYYRYDKLTGETVISSIDSQPVTSTGTTNDSNITGGPNALQLAYTPNNNTFATDSTISSGLRTVVTGNSFNRMAAAFPSGTYLTATDAEILPFVDNYFTYERWNDHEGADGVGPVYGGGGYGYGGAGYDTMQNPILKEGYMLGTRYRVTSETSQGSGASSSGGQSTTNYEYAQNYDDSMGGTSELGASTFTYSAIDYNIWRTKTTEFLPTAGVTGEQGEDREITYTNTMGQPLMTQFVTVGSPLAITTPGMTIVNQSDNLITVNVANSFTVGQSIAISGVLPELYDGVFTIHTRTSSSFTFYLPTDYYYSPVEAVGSVPYPFAFGSTPSPGSVSVQGYVAPVASTRDTYYQYDQSGRLIQTLEPSSVSGLDDTTPDLVTPGSSGAVSTSQVAGWTFTGYSGIAANASSPNTIMFSGAPNAADGSEAAFLLYNGSVSQQFLVPQGTSGSYSLAFKFATNAGLDYLYDDACVGFEVLIDGVAQSISEQGTTTTLVETPFGTLGTVSYFSATATISLSAGLHTIEFVADPSAYDSWSVALLLDKVSLTSGSTSVISDGSFEALGLSTGQFTFDPTQYPLSGSGSTATDVDGMTKETFVQDGPSGELIPQESFQYITHSAGGPVVVKTATDTTYGSYNFSTHAPLDPRTTIYTYNTWYSGTLVESMTITDPPITGSQNGPATSTSDTADADTTTEYLDPFGNITWTMDGDGYITYDNYDPMTGALLKSISDVDTADGTDFSGLPSGWTTPSGGGQELITTYTVDVYGRTLSEYTPNHHTTYTVYIDGPTVGGTDPNNGATISTSPTSMDVGGFYNEVFTYPDWHYVTALGKYTTTGPVQVSREDSSSTILSGTSNSTGTTSTLIDSTGSVENPD